MATRRPTPTKGNPPIQIGACCLKNLYSGSPWVNAGVFAIYKLCPWMLKHHKCEGLSRASSLVITELRSNMRGAAAIRDWQPLGSGGSIQLLYDECDTRFANDSIRKLQKKLSHQSNPTSCAFTCNRPVLYTTGPYLSLGFDASVAYNSSCIMCWDSGVDDVVKRGVQGL